jgi:hypothetical protein
VEQKYAQCHFVSCESANSAVELISIVGTHLGLKPSRQLSRAIVQHSLDSGPAILVLDNNLLVQQPYEPSDGFFAMRTIWLSDGMTFESIHLLIFL